jgi:hypothetical protein
MTAVRRNHQPSSRGARPAATVPAIAALSAAVLDLRDAAAGLAARLRAGTGPSSPPGTYARTAAACTAAQMTAQAWLLVQAAMPPGPALDTGQANGLNRAGQAPAGDDAPQLAGAAWALGAMTTWLADRSGEPAARQLSGAAACLAAARGELSRTAAGLPHTAGTR